MFRIAYTLGIVLLDFTMQLGGLRSVKLRTAARIRKHKEWKQLPPKHKKRILVHCASLGEYYQSLPYVALYESNGFEPIFSFFSTSGYELVKLKEDRPVYYLPIDYQSAQQEFIAMINPDIFLGVKYEWWWNLLSVLHKSGVTIVYTNLYFVHKPWFLKWAFTSSIFSCIDYISCIDPKTQSLLGQYVDESKVVWVRDSRIDNVIKRMNELPTINTLNSDVLIWGSVYPYEIPLIAKVIKNQQRLRHIVVPHHVDKQTIDQFCKRLGAVVYDPSQPASVSIVDEIGLLFGLYQGAMLAYVGGGFTNGLHNVFEPLVFGVPVICGNNTSKFPEAQLMENEGFLKMINNKEAEFEMALQDFMANKAEISTSMAAFFSDNNDQLVDFVNHTIRDA